MDSVEITLATLPLAHVYKLPPRPDARGWQCQLWPKENHIFTARVVVVALNDLCTIRLMDGEKGTLFAQCPLDNDNPQLSVEPANDSSRYFVLRVSDGSGRHAFLGMGFLERSEAFEFNVTLQDHVKRLRNEREALAARDRPAPPPQDFSLKGSVSISLPGGATPKPRAAAAPPPPGGLGALLPPPPAGGGPSRGRRPVGSATETAQPSAAASFSSGAPAFGPADAFATADAFANTFGQDPFAPSTATTTAPPAAAPAADQPFGSSDLFGSATFAPTSGFGADPFGASTSFGDTAGTTAGSGEGGADEKGWVSFGS